MNNRRRGHNWERKCLQYLSGIFKDIKTSRYASKMKDDQKVDLCFTDPFNFQCKLSNKKLDYAEILSEMPEDENINVILNKLRYKAGENFVSKGEFAILRVEDLIKLIEGYVGDGTSSSNDKS